MQSTKYPGVPFQMDGQEYVIPSLSLRQFQDNYELLTAPVGELTAGSIQAQFSRFVPVIGMAIRRNYPEISDDALMDLLDLGSFRDALLAVQAASGMKPAKPGEAAPAAK